MYSESTQLAVTTASGFSAGVICATVSHPMDTLVSRIYSAQGNQAKSFGKMVSNIYKEIGFLGLWKGLNQRIMMVGCLTACQWFIYDKVKKSFGMKTGAGIKKAGETSADDPQTSAASLPDTSPETEARIEKVFSVSNIENTRNAKDLLNVVDEY